jgi:hypothetical protein
MSKFVIEKKPFGTASDVPTATVTKDSIYINKAARAAFGIDEFPYLELVGDDEEPVLSLRLLNQPSLHSNTVRVTDGSLMISAVRAIKQLGMEPGRYDLTQSRGEKNTLEFTYDVAEATSEEEGDAEEDVAEHRRGRGRPKKAA